MPTLEHYETVTSGGQSTATLTTSSFTVAVGDVIVVKRSTENYASGAYYSADPTASGGGITFTSQVAVSSSGGCDAAIFTGTVTSAGSITVTVGQTTSPNSHSGVVERWSSAGVGASSINTSSSETYTLTTTADEFLRLVGRC